MKTRAITGIFFIAVMLGSLLCGHYVFGGFYLLLSLLCLQEFYKLIRQATIFRPNVFAGLLSAAAIYIIFALVSYQDGPSIHKLLSLLVPVLVAVFILELFKDQPTPISNIAYTLTGILFAAVPFTFFHALAYITHSGFNFHIPMAFLLMLWANDTGAYLVGRSLGRTKLFERHSPKKTWEGFIGGVLISAGVGYIISIYFKDMPWNNWISVAIIISLVGTLGDLVESMFKRSLNIKDSGGILPGHGGLLDRFDGLLMAAPVVFT
jgi:phosphatidate cytidylyltransferase